MLGEEVTARRTAWCSTTPHRPHCCGIYGDALPSRYAKALRRYRFGPGVAKVDFVLSGEIPWRDARLAHAPTLHLGGTRARWLWPRREIAEGRHADWPMVLAALPAPRRPRPHRRGGRRPLWTYAHVPSGSTVDMAETVTGIFERFAPGFRDIVVGGAACPPHDWPTTTPT